MKVVEISYWNCINWCREEKILVLDGEPTEEEIVEYVNQNVLQFDCRSRQGYGDEHPTDSLEIKDVINGGNSVIIDLNAECRSDLYEVKN